MDNFYVKLEEEEETRRQKHMVVYRRISGSYELKTQASLVCLLALAALGVGLARESRALDLRFYLSLLASLVAAVHLWAWAADNADRVKLDEELLLNGARLAALLQFGSAACNAWLAFGHLVQARFPAQLADGLQLSSGSARTLALLLGLAVLCQLRSLYLMGQATWNELEVAALVFLPAGVLAVYSGTRILFSLAYWTEAFPLQTCRVVLILLLIAVLLLAFAALRIRSRKSDSVFSAMLGCSVLSILFVGAFGIPCFDSLSSASDSRTLKNVSFSLRHFPLLLLSCIASLQTAGYLYQTHHTTRKPTSDLTLKLVFLCLLLTALCCTIYPQDEPGNASPRPSA